MIRLPSSAHNMVSSVPRMCGDVILPQIRGSSAGGDRVILAVVGADPELGFGVGPDGVRAHQPGHSVAADPVAFGFQAGMHLRAAVGPSALAVGGLNLES